MNNKKCTIRPVQINGFSWPNGPNYYQFVSWTYFLLDFIFVYIFYLVELTEATKVIIKKIKFNSSEYSYFMGLIQYSYDHWNMLQSYLY